MLESLPVQERAVRAEKDQAIEQRKLDVEKQRSLENEDELDGPDFEMYSSFLAAAFRMCLHRVVPDIGE
jgi:hypothetical protein